MSIFHTITFEDEGLSLSGLISTDTIGFKHIDNFVIEVWLDNTWREVKVVDREYEFDLKRRLLEDLEDLHEAEKRERA